MGRSGGSRPYHRKREYRHSCAPSSVPFTVDGCTVRHAHVFITRCKRREIWIGAPISVSSSASSNRLALLFHTYSIPSIRYVAWSTILNSYYNLSAVTRFPVMTQDAVQFSGAVFVGYGNSRHTGFTGRLATPRPGVPSPTPWKRDSMNKSLSAFLTGQKASPMLEVTRCTNPHSCWSDFCSPA